MKKKKLDPFAIGCYLILGLILFYIVISITYMMQVIMVYGNIDERDKKFAEETKAMLQDYIDYKKGE